VTRLLTSLRRFRRSYAQLWTDGGPGADLTRPGAARIREGVPIAHDGPPDFPGRPALPGDADPLLMVDEEAAPC